LIINRGEILFSQGEMGDLYHLKSGLLKITHTHPNGDCSIVNLLVPEEVFPHHSLVSPKDYYGTAIAVLPSEVERISAEEWYTSLETNPVQYKVLAGILQDNLRKMQKRIEMTTLPAKDRIPYLREWLAVYCSGYAVDEILTQEEIGPFLGMSRETVNRNLPRKRVL
jgi:CRP-like cAMP-binding protein